MAQHTVYDQDLNVSNDTSSPESIGVSPSSEFVPLFGSGARSSTWPMSRYESFETDPNYGEDGYENEDVNENENRTEEAEPEASTPGPSESCEYRQPERFQPLISQSDF